MEFAVWYTTAAITVPCLFPNVPIRVVKRRPGVLTANVPSRCHDGVTIAGGDNVKFFMQSADEE
ncbi:hypothetical protein GQ53DRAFT_744979 [Thozetella sp. PMI_491]|nr:hypothetical protein GQ53DRAFT_744979 [Thozetella sp. PMI_491]